MSSQVTLSLRDDLRERAEELSRSSGRPVTDVLMEAIDASIYPFGPLPSAGPPVADLGDAEVLATADSMMDPAQGDRLSDLLARQREGELTPTDRTELMSLMQVYQVGQLRKAQALAEAVRRGLRGPPPP